MPQSEQIDKNPASAGSLDNRNEIRITCHQNNILRYVIETDPCNIQPNLDVHALLFHIRNEVIIDKRRFPIVCRLQYPPIER